MKIGRDSTIGRILCNWPTQVEVGSGSAILDGVVLDFCHGTPQAGPSILIGDQCLIGRGAEFNVRRRISVGSNSLVAAGVRFIDHDHGIAIGQLIREQYGTEEEIIIGEDVWIGVNAVILKGVHVGDGAVIGAGAVVTRSIPAMEIWAGVPARRMGSRVAI